MTSALPDSLKAHTLCVNVCHGAVYLQAVWEVLTDYNRLAEFIPNLAVSQRIALPRSAPANVIRVRQASLLQAGRCVPRRTLPALMSLRCMQVGYKRMLYMCLHAESVLDLIEKPQR